MDKLDAYAEGYTNGLRDGNLEAMNKLSEYADKEIKNSLKSKDVR